MTSPGREVATRLIDAYTEAVAADLRGPRSARRAAIDEVRDHLVEAVDGRAEGRDPIEVAEATIIGFGRPGDLARRLQPGLDRRIGRRAALLLLGVTSGITSLWLVIFLSGPPAPWTEPAEPRVLAWTDVVGSAAMKIALVSAVVAVCASWVLPRLIRRTAIADHARRWAGWGWRLGIGTLALSVATILGYAFGRGFVAPWSLEWSDVAIGAFVTCSAMLGLGRIRNTWSSSSF